MKKIQSNKLKAIKLRRMGFSYSEIAKQLKISKSTTSWWLSEIKLSQIAQKRLQEKISTSQKKGAAIRKRVGERTQKELLQTVLKELASIKVTKPLAKLVCALMYREAGKNNKHNRLSITSSDPGTVTIFMKLLRFGFTIDSRKLRALMYLYRTHNEAKQKAFWSRVSGIPESQFTKTHLQKQPKKRDVASYSGSLRITYYDSRIAHELAIWYNAFAKLVKGA